MPFGFPQREKPFRCRSTHFFAKASIFSFCVGVLNKNANAKAEDLKLRANMSGVTT